MYNIVITPNNSEEFSLIEKMLVKMNVAFQKVSAKNSNEVILSEEEITAIKKGDTDFEKAKVFHSDEVRKIMSQCVE